MRRVRVQSECDSSIEASRFYNFFKQHWEEIRYTSKLVTGFFIELVGEF